MEVKPPSVNAKRPNGFREPDSRAVKLTGAFLDAILDGPNHRDLYGSMGSRANYPLDHEFLQKHHLLPLAESLFPEPLHEILPKPNISPYSAFPDVNNPAWLHSQTLYAMLTVPFFSKIEVVDEIDAGKLNVRRYHERDYENVVVQLPTYLDWMGEGINSVETANMDNLPDRFKAVCEHICLIRLLLENKVEVSIMRPKPEWPEGVYMRDIGFVIGDKLIRANMAADVRKPEQSAIKNSITLPEGKIEGGNVFVEWPNVLVGVGDRTDYAAVKCLQAVLGSDFEVIPLELKPGVLHLDCVFNPLERTTGRIIGAAFIDKNAFLREGDVRILEKIYTRLLQLPQKEIEILATNFISSGELFVNTNCRGLAQSLKGLGYSIKHLGLGETLKGDGSTRCATLPLK